MKKAILMLMLSSIGVGSFAQQTEQKVKLTAEQKAQRKTEKLSKQLNLNDAQAKQIYALSLQNCKARQADKQAMHAKHKEMRKQNQAQMQQILSAEQYKNYQQMLLAKREAHKQKKMKMKELRLKENKTMPEELRKG